MNSLVSIIIPVFNGEAFLEDALKSCINQSYENIEIIIVNDCSSDKSLSIAEKFRQNDKRIKIISNKVNLKLPISLNVGHIASKGKYLTWTSDDNILNFNMIESLVEALETTKSDLVFSNYDVIESNGEYRRTHNFGPVASLPFGSCIGASFLYKKNVFEELGGYDENLFLLEDYDFWLRASLKFKFFHLRTSLYKYRVHNANLTSQISYDKNMNLSFKLKHIVVYQKLVESLQGSEKLNTFLLMVRGYEAWDWSFLKINFKLVKSDLELYQKKILSNDDLNSLEFLDRILRNRILTLDCDKKILWWLLISRPGILFSKQLSKKNSLKIIYKLFK